MTQCVMLNGDFFDVIDVNDDESHQSLPDESVYYYDFHMDLNDFDEIQEHEQYYYELYSMNNNDRSSSKIESDERIVSNVFDQNLGSVEKENFRQATQCATIPSEVFQSISTLPLVPEHDALPDYLCIEHSSFDRLFNEHRDSHTENDIEELRRYAYNQHYLLYYTRLHHLWSFYLRRSQRHGVSSTRFCWATHVKSTFQAFSHQLSLSTAMITMTNEEKHTIYEYFVRQYLHKLQNKIQYYRKEIDQQDTVTTKEEIINFVERYGIFPLQMKCDFAMAILDNEEKYDQLIDECRAEKPSEYQLQIAERLDRIRLQLEIMKNEWIVHRLRLLYNKPPLSYDALQIDSISELFHRRPFLCRYRQLIETVKTKLILVRFMVIETLIDQYQTILNDEIDQIHRASSLERFSSTFVHLIDQRMNLIQEKLKIISTFYVNDRFRYDFHIHERTLHRQLSHESKRIGFATNLFVDLSIDSLNLTSSQIHLLNRGPTYVSPHQLHLTSLFPSTNTPRCEAWTSIAQQLTYRFRHDDVDTQKSTIIEKQIKDLCYSFFSSVDISMYMRQRIVFEQQRIHAMRDIIQNDGLLLCRLSDHTNRFYLMRKDRFEEKCQQYWIKYHRCYERLHTIVAHQQIYRINTKLERLLHCNQISADVHEQLSIRIDELRFGYLYFLPKFSFDNNDFIVEPMFSMYKSLTWKIANYVYDLLEPIVLPLLLSSIIINERELIDRLHAYSNRERRLRPTTIFVRLKLTNFYRMFSHLSIINRVGYILTTVRSNAPIENLSIVTIEDLIELVLQNTLFYYQGEIYRFLDGLPNSMRLSDLLLSICLYYWKTKVVDDHRLNHELFVRCKDEIFFTWNDSEKDLREFLDRIKRVYHDDIEMDTCYGHSITFRDIYIENRHGQVYSRVCGRDRCSTFSLPYVVGYPNELHRRWFQASLRRALHVCSHYDDFYQERLSLEISCSLSGYTHHWIECELMKFYHYYRITQHRFRMTPSSYEHLRRRLLTSRATRHDNTVQRSNRLSNKTIHRIFYIYRYGAYQRFEDKVHELWSTFMKPQAATTNPLKTISLSALHLFSLNTLLAEPKSIYKLFK